MKETSPFRSVAFFPSISGGLVAPMANRLNGAMAYKMKRPTVWSVHGLLSLSIWSNAPNVKGRYRQTRETKVSVWRYSIVKDRRAADVPAGCVTVPTVL